MIEIAHKNEDINFIKNLFFFIKNKLTEKKNRLTGNKSTEIL
jgi:hypothetical protein